ncbi:STE family protein kinase [Tritrichomonas foetus]|uniref:non-specific serine/threonine protein kinase n=1 Tax=Tritrichomonas foetus TaxID=1144522 RepID=A0A1J4KL72_9EUKA|nr:STE family protein kinase [Tritrichomonas foetus]|eukprot:OHT12055.1 STE family protein kinase [Tritrichomonas foetus]
MNNAAYVSLHRRPRNTPQKKHIKRNENMPMNGPTLLDRYMKQETLGEGAFGLVYKAFDQETGKSVAIKCLKTKESIESFQAELDLLKRLHHSAIVPYIDSFYDGKGNLQIVMEYADNGSILDVIHKYGNLNESVAAIYISQVLQGLAYLHKQNVLHRDIKAANILIQCGVAKLADFGLALDLNEYGHTLRECAGTPYWMAPEVINGDPVDHKSDIWSVGSTTYELLKGRPPFFDLAPLPAMFQIAGNRPMPIPNDVSESCKSFLLMCFKKNPKERPEASQLLTHDWIQQAVTIVKQAESSLRMKKKSQDFRSLSLCLESMSGTLSTFMQKQIRTSEEIIFDLNDENQYIESVFSTIELLNKKKGIPQLVLNFCGIRTLIDRYEKKEYRIITLNFLQELCSHSDKIATSLIEHTLLTQLLTSKDVHSQITGLHIIMSSSIGGKLFFACGLNNIIGKLFKDPLLKIFFSSFMLYLLKCGLPKDILYHKLFTEPMLKLIAETAFKSIALLKEYKKILDASFKCLKSVKTAEDLCVRRLSQSLFEKSYHYIDDSITLLMFAVSSTTGIQIKIANEMNPITYMITKPSDFPALTTKYVSKLIMVLDTLFRDCVARTRIRSDLLIEPLVTFSFSEDKEVSLAAIHCLTRMLMNRPELIEQAVEAGLCLSLSYAISKDIAFNFVRHLICYIPTVSKFAAYKMKEADLFYVLIDLISIKEWRDKALHAISCWATFNSSYVDQQMQNDTDQAVFSCIETCIEMINSFHIRLSSFYDLKNIVRKCPVFTNSLINEDFITSIISSIKNAREYQSDLLELLLEIILQADDPADFASSLLPQLKGYSESNDFHVQKVVLRIRVVSGC